MRHTSRNKPAKASTRGFRTAVPLLLFLHSATVTFSSPPSTPEPHPAFWLQSSLKRVYPKSPPGSEATYKLVAARNSTISFQACVQNSQTHFLAAKCRVTGPDDVKIQVRKVGYVPLWKVTGETPVSDLEGLDYSPGLVPDPLYPEPQEWI